MIPINHLIYKKGDRKMKRINIDIETYSEADLTKSGVYKYVDKTSGFEVLLFGYSVDGGTTTTLNSGTTNVKPTVISGTIPYATTGTKTKTIRVFIKWVDNTAEGATMSDTQDSQFTWDDTNRQITLKVDASFEQKTT